jgi:Sigma-70, region 4/Bacterial RNA polymerase, alpha chain C terminal domain
MQLDGLLAGTHDLGTKSIRQVLDLESFGAKSLVDLLTSLEGARTMTAPPIVVTSDVKQPTTMAETPLAASALVGRFRNLRLPALPGGARLTDLELANRTYNCLAKHGFADHLADLTELTLGDVLEIPGFGMRCLVDYLDAVDRFRRGEKRQPQELGAPIDLFAEMEPHQYLEDELRDVFRRGFKEKATAQSSRNTDVVLMYYGGDGGGGTTLREIGVKYGMTRERVRQICDRLSQRVKQYRSQLPRLRAVLDMIVQHLPSEAETIEQLLQTERFTRNRFKLDGLLHICKLFGHTPQFELEEIDGRRMIVHSEKLRLTRRTIVEAHKAVSRFGVATIIDLAAILSEKLSRTIAPEYVARALLSQSGFEWLDHDAGWFWFRNLPKNRVVSRVRKILSVSERIDVAELRTGIARHHAMKGYAPPRKTLLELCKRLPFCVVDGTVVRAEPPIDWKSVLSGAELSLIAVLKEYGPVMPRATLEQLCLRNGMNRSTFYVYLGYSPVIERYASSVYGIRGARIEPGVVESLIPHRHPTKGVRLDHGWTRDRRIWIGYRLSEGMLGNGAFSVPSGSKQFLQGKYAMRAEDGAAIGTIVVKDNVGWGLGTLFRRRGGEPGDTLLLVFDAKARVVIASIGDESLVDQFENEGAESLDSSKLA